METDILWTTRHMEAARRNIRAMISRMRENGRVSPFVIYTPKYRLFWLPENTAIGYAGEGGKKGTAFFDSDILGFVDNVSRDGEFEINAISPTPKDEKELVESVFGFLKNKCLLDQLDTKRSVSTAERLDLQSAAATEDDSGYDDGMNGSCGPADAD